MSKKHHHKHPENETGKNEVQTDKETSGKMQEEKSFPEVSENIINDLNGSSNKDAKEEFSDAKESLKQKDDEIKELKEQIMRLQAEFENAKRRMQESCETVKEYASEKIICDLLPLIDNLERAKASADITRDFDSLSEGIGLILRQLKDILGKEGLQVIECMGQLFDPVYHQAVQREENDEIEDDTILDEFQKGYLLKNKLIRPSLVKVAKNQN